MAHKATESQIGIALALAAIIMTAMLYAIVWQSNIIGHQRELIRSLTHFGN